MLPAFQGETVIKEQTKGVVHIRFLLQQESGASGKGQTAAELPIQTESKVIDSEWS